MAPPRTKGIPALRLVLPGAPDNWHTIGPVSTEDGAELQLAGHFHTEKPTPLGGPVSPSLEDAKAYIAAHRKMVARAAAGWEAQRAELAQSGRPDIGEFDPPPCPVELCEVSESEAETLRAELFGLHGAALKAAYLARQEGDGALPHVESQAAAVAAGDTNQED